MCVSLLLLLVSGCVGHDEKLNTEKLARIMMIEDMRTPDPAIRSFAKDTDAMIRTRAALAIGRIGSEELVDTLKELLTDTEPDVRESACFAAGIMGSQGIAELLASRLDDENPQVRAAAVDAICRLKYGPLTSRVSERLSDPERSVIERTLLSLWKMNEPGAQNAALDTILDRIIEISRSKDMDLKWKAAYCLMRLSDPRSFDRIAELARDEMPLIRSLAARALDSIDHPGTSEVLVQLCNDDDWKVSVIALRSAAGKGKLLKQEAISGLLENDNMHIVLSALHALPLLDGNRTEDLITRFLDAEAPSMRGAAVLALSKLHPDRFMPIAEKMAKDSDWRVRAATARALGNVRHQNALPLLFTLSDDLDARVVPDVITAVMKHKPDNPIASINHLFLKQDFVIRATALSEISALLFNEGASGSDEKKIYGEEMKKMFLEILKASYDIAASDNEPDAKLETLNAASQFFSESDAQELIRSALKDGDYIVRRRAAEILKERTGEDHFIETFPAISGRTIDFYLSALEHAKKRKNAIIRTEKGDITIAFHPNEAPLTVKNFCDLAEKEFYNGKDFHRVVSNFVIQDGCPRGDGWGSAGYRIRCEVSPLEYVEGAVGMAHSGKDTGGSQFFITHSAQPHLTGRYTLFGHVVSGMDIVERIMPNDRILSIEIVQ